MAKIKKPRAGVAKRSTRTSGRIAATTILRPEHLRKESSKELEREGGPLGWFVPQVEGTYSRLESPASLADRPTRPAAARKGAAPRGMVRPQMTGPGLVDAAPADLWIDRLAEYKQRKAAATLTRLAPAPGMVPTAPAITGARNWLPLGPSVVMHGQTIGEEPIGGRVCGIAVVPGGQVIYAATACGGVFRSDDGATTWRSLMDGFDVNPTNFASASLACGAIGVDSADPNRVYVGTGEGDTHQLFRRRIVSALPAYRGIGPIRTDDGGASWITEATASGSPPLAGEAFFALAIDPANREHVVAATTAGLYERVRHDNGDVEWVQRRSGVHSSVIAVTVGGHTRFLAAEWGQRVICSDDGAAWTTLGTGFPATDVGRIALGAQRASGNVVYAVVVIESTGGLLGIYRLDGQAGAWKQIANPPDVLPLINGRSQGAYDVAISVDPNLATRIYLGGSFANVSPFPASVWRVDVQAIDSGWRFVSPRSIGTHAHADVHVLVHTPGDSDELWCGCDGGIFLNRHPTGTGEFAGENAGLSCLCTNFIAQHPTDPNILFSGLQDNGTARTGGGPLWSRVNSGDGGYCVINWADPSRVLSFANGVIYRSTNGGATAQGWASVWKFGWTTMTQPIVSVPFAPADPSAANIVAAGAGQLVFVSTDFASSWPQDLVMTVPGGTAAGSVFALAFASRTRLFIGTTAGRVFRADRSGTGWIVTRIDNAAGGPLGVSGLITDVAVDLSDATLASIYVAFGGLGDRRRVWHFDGTRWEVRSGTTQADHLLDVEHNALVVDPVAPENVYVGADIGVWHSSDRGATWAPLENGLPDAPVFDLQMHPTRRLLRAATYGRGVYEIGLD
jgi:hypothetical protein